MEALLLRKIPANGIDSTVAVTIAFLILSSCYLVYQVAAFTDRPYPSIPLIGKDASTTTTSAAKARWVTSARQLISSGLRIGKPFQVLATVRPMIILPAKYIDEIKNHANFNFSKAVESNFYGKYPGFDGLNSLNQNEVFQDAIRVRLTKNLSMLNQILCSHITGVDLSVCRQAGHPACSRSRDHGAGNISSVPRCVFEKSYHL